MPPGGTLHLRVFRTRTFGRWQRKSRLTDQTLLDAVGEVRAGLFDANLGGLLFKKRAGLPGTGKRGGGRLVIATRHGERWFLLFGYAKNERTDLTPRELSALQAWAGVLLSLDDEQLKAALAAGELQEVFHGGDRSEEEPGSR